MHMTPICISHYLDSPTVAPFTPTLYIVGAEGFLLGDFSPRVDDSAHALRAPAMPSQLSKLLKVVTRLKTGVGHRPPTTKQ